MPSAATPCGQPIESLEAIVVEHRAERVEQLV